LHQLETKALSHAATENVSVTSGEDNGPYTNISIETHQIAELWAMLSPVIINDEALSSCVIACCEGDSNWDDYLLLFHFDKSQTIDALP
jgi:hypothetical protein